MNYRSILSYCEENNVRVMESKLIATTTINPRMRAEISKHRERLLDDLSASGRLATDSDQPDGRELLVKQIMQLHRSIDGMEDFDLSEFSLKELQDWKKWLKKKMPEIILDQLGSTDFVGNEVPNNFPKPQWKYQSCLTETGSLRWKDKRPARLEELNYHFQDEEVSKFYIDLTSVSMSDRGSQKISLRGREGKKTWQDWYSSWISLLKKRSPHIDPHNPTLIIRHG